MRKELAASLRAKTNGENCCYAALWRVAARQRRSLYGWRERIDINGLMALALVMVFLVFRDTAGAQPLFYLAFVCGVLTWCRRRLARSGTPLGAGISTRDRVAR